MKARKTKLVIALAAFVLIALAFVFPVGKPDINAVHPRFASLQEPIRVTAVAYFLDGGSIELRITDAFGRTNTFALPVSSSANTDRYPHFVCASIRTERPNQKNLIPLDATTKSYIAYLLEHRTSRGSDATLVLIELRGTPRDYGSFMIELLRQRLFQ